MGTTYAELLRMLIETRDADYRSDPERRDAIFELMVYVLQTMLEKLAEP